MGVHGQLIAVSRMLCPGIQLGYWLKTAYWVCMDNALLCGNLFIYFTIYQLTLHINIFQDGHLPESASARPAEKREASWKLAFEANSEKKLSWNTQSGSTKRDQKARNDQS